MAKSKAKAQSGRGWWILLGLIAILATIASIYRVQISGYTQIATAYSARVACSCHFVAGRSIDDCAKDKLAGMELVTLKANTDAKSVTARFPLIASDTAYYREGYGCVLEKWEE
ncbi:hypothetical protein [Altererythrobacter sp. GH1-8]|uniref:hypothetical protein n=1 Tax=Altererythrobacter sp. GH1-8 TaxID=3349333 RepID=UPI00374DE6B7